MKKKFIVCEITEILNENEEVHHSHPPTHDNLNTNTFVLPSFRGYGESSVSTEPKQNSNQMVFGEDRPTSPHFPKIFSLPSIKSQIGQRLM